MDKVLVTETKKIETEIDLEYPIYLYFQDGYCNDELIMLTKKHK